MKFHICHRCRYSIWTFDYEPRFCGECRSTEIETRSFMNWMAAAVLFVSAAAWFYFG